MLFRSGIVFLICAIFMHVVNGKTSANVSCLLYDNEDIPLPKWAFVTVQYCHKKREYCCGTECCTLNTWLILLGAVGLLLGVFVCLFACFARGSNSQNNTNSSTMNTNQTEPRRDFSDLAIITTLLANRHVVVVQESNPEESNSRPITPPPSYNVAMLTPYAPPILPENRIPSYEDISILPENRIPSYEDISTGRIT